MSDYTKPFQPEEVTFRLTGVPAGNGAIKAFTHIDPRALQRRLVDHGFDENPMYEANPPVKGENGNFVCVRSIRHGGDTGIYWSGVGIGFNEHESENNAYFRAACKFGIGEYLYDLPTLWVNEDEYGKGVGYYLKDSAKQRLRDWYSEHVFGEVESKETEDINEDLPQVRMTVTLPSLPVGPLDLFDLSNDSILVGVVKALTGDASDDTPIINWSLTQSDRQKAVQTLIDRLIDNNQLTAMEAGERLASVGKAQQTR